MKEIKLNKVGYLRGEIVSATVDETKLEFKNGIALAEATVIEIVGNCEKKYRCLGLVNENYCEVYGTSLTEENGIPTAETFLMFLEKNKKGFRCGNNDFLVEYKYKDVRTRINDSGYCHLCIKDGLPVLVYSHLDFPQKTSYENLIIIGNDGYQRIYDISKSYFITPALFSISESKINKEVFDVVARVTPYECTEEMFGYEEDYLFFKINLSGQRISQVISSITRDYLTVCGNTSVIEILEKRKEELLLRQEQFNKMISDFKNDAQCLENYSQELKLNLKQEVE